jgi:hypothetical protein
VNKQGLTESTLSLENTQVWQVCNLEMTGNTVVKRGSIVGRRWKQHRGLKDCMSEMKESIWAQLGYTHHLGNIVGRLENNLEMLENTGENLESNGEMWENLGSIEVNLVNTEETMENTGERLGNIVGRWVSIDVKQENIVAKRENNLVKLVNRWEMLGSM